MAARESQPMSFVPVATAYKTTRRPFCGKAAARERADPPSVLPTGQRVTLAVVRHPSCGSRAKGENLIYSNEIRESPISGPMAVKGTRSSEWQHHRRLVNERFHDRALRREEVYQRQDLFSVIHQQRQARALSWIDGLGLPAGTRVLEIGPGRPGSPHIIWPTSTRS
jgi:hypothetical protein